MRRFLPALCLSFSLLFIGCDPQHNMLGTIIKKRVYLDGFYVHVPGKRQTPINDYPPPSQYPQEYTHIADIARFRDSMYQVRQDSIRAAIAYRDSMAELYATMYARDTMKTVYTPYTPYGNPYGGYPNPYAGMGYPQRDTVRRYVPVTTRITHYITDTIHYTSYRDSITHIVKNDTIVRFDTLRQVVTYDSIIPVYDTSYVTKMDTVHHHTDIEIIKPAPKSMTFPPTTIEGYAQAGLMNLPDGNVYAVKAGSNSFGFGMRTKSLITLRGSVGIDVGYRRDELFPEQTCAKTSPFIPGLYDRERVKFHAFTEAVCWRHTFHHGYKKQSWWFDVGGYAEQIFKSKDVAIKIDNSSDLGNRMKTRIRVSGLAGLKKQEYGLTIRIGHGWLAGFATYRMNSMVKEGYGAGDLPKLTVGVDFSLGEEK